MLNEQQLAPDSTAARVALWRALHVQVDAPPHVFTDEIGLQLVAPTDDWRGRGDMDPDATSRFRAGHVAWARFVEDLVIERVEHGVRQYVLLGAGVDTFVPRRPEMADSIRVFEVDQPGAQAWKRQRLNELGFGVPDWQRLVPVDFEAGASWWEHLVSAGFDPGGPAVVTSIGVSMYLSRAATMATLRQVAALGAGSTFVMTFMPPIEQVDEADRPGRLMSERGARSSGTPFISFYSPAEMLALAREAGFADVAHVSTATSNARYFAGRPDGLRAASGADLLVAGSGAATESQDRSAAGRE